MEHPYAGILIYMELYQRLSKEICDSLKVVNKIANKIMYEPKIILILICSLVWIRSQYNILIDNFYNKIYVDVEVLRMFLGL